MNSQAQIIIGHSRRVKKCGGAGLTAISMKLGWVLSGPYGDGKGSNSSTSMVTHMMKVTSDVG